MPDPKIPSSGSAVPADVQRAMDRGVRQRYALSESQLPASKTKGVQR